jgi:hypothetical protein
MYDVAAYISILCVLAGLTYLANTYNNTTHKIQNDDYSCTKNAREQVDLIEYADDILTYFIIECPFKITNTE